jgi:hypothetical protein
MHSLPNRLSFPWGYLASVASILKKVFKHLMLHSNFHHALVVDTALAESGHIISIPREYLII